MRVGHLEYPSKAKNLGKNFLKFFNIQRTFKVK